MRAHAYPDEATALDAIEAIDAARPSTEDATTYLGARSKAQAIRDGFAAARGQSLTVTSAGLAAGYAVEGDRLVRHHTIPRRTWASPIPLADGTFAVPVCTAVERAEVTVRGVTKTIPYDSTARTITAIDVKREPIKAEPIVPAKG